MKQSTIEIGLEIDKKWFAQVLQFLYIFYYFEIALLCIGILLQSKISISFILLKEVLA